MSFRIYKLGEVSFRIYKLGEFIEVSFGMLKLGELGEVSFGKYNLVAPLEMICEISTKLIFGPKYDF